MADQKKNVYGHPSIAKPTQDRFSQMTNLINEEVHEQPQETVQTGDLEQLIFLGCIEDSKKINGYTFDFRTLTGKELNDVWLSVSFLTSDTKLFVVKTAYLARAIKAVNGRPLDIMYKAADYRELTKEQRCLKVVESWQDTLINELYEFYSQLVNRSREAINEPALKK